MAHNIAKINGKDAFFSNRQPAWHGLGQVVDGAQTGADAMRLAQLNWHVEKRQLLDPRTLKTIGAWGTFRTDNGAFLGVVGSQYEPVQNDFLFDFMDTLLEQDGGAHYETAGALGDGNRVWCLAKMPSADIDIHGIGDKHESYALVCAGHDGTLSIWAMLTSTRVVCQNTLSMAIHGKDGKRALKLKHTPNVAEKLAEAKKLMTGTMLTAKGLQSKLEALANRKMSSKALTATIEQLFPAANEKGELSTQSANALEKIIECYMNNDGGAFAEVKGTAYNFLNGVTEYVDHVKANRNGESAIFNGAADFKTNALDIILAATAGAPYHEVRKPMVAVAGARAAQTAVIELEAVGTPADFLNAVIDTTAMKPKKSALDSILDNSGLN